MGASQSASFLSAVSGIGHLLGALNEKHPKRHLELKKVAFNIAGAGCCPMSPGHTWQNREVGQTGCLSHHSWVLFPRLMHISARTG